MTSILMVRVCLIVHVVFREAATGSLINRHFYGENIALKRPTEQTPGTFKDITPPYKSYPGSLAVDGIDDNNFLLGSCSHTSGSPYGQDLPIASWKVFLGGMFHVTGIVLVNRKGREDRLKDFIIYGLPYRTSQDWQEIYNDKGKNAYTNDTIYISLDGSVHYSVIAVNLPKHHGNPDHGVSYLSLCEVKIYADECPGIHKSEHVTKVTPQSQLYHANELVTTTCKHGYKTMTKNPIKCLIGGKWDSPIPTCQSIKCPNLTKPKNGHYITVTEYSSRVPISSSGLEFGTKVKGECDIGYTSHNDQYRDCLIDGTWSGQETTCTPVVCPYPGNITNGVYVLKDNSRVFPGHNFSYKTVLKPSCNKGYTLRRQDYVLLRQEERTCQNNETWTGEKPYCDIVTCQFPGQYDNGYYVIKNNKITPTSELHYFKGHLNYSIEIEALCERSYILNSTHSVRRCTSEGNLTGETPICLPVMCQWPIYISQGYYKPSRDKEINGMPYNTTLTAFCNDSYKLTGEYKTRRCNESALWDKKPPICTLPITQEQKFSKGGLIGGASSGVVVLLVVAVTVFFLYRRRKTLRNKTERSLQSSHLQRTEREHDRSTSSPGYDYVEVGAIGFKTNTREVKATGVATNRSNVPSEKYGAYSAATTDQTMSVVASSVSLQSDQAYYSFSEANKLPASAMKVKDLSDLILTGKDAKKKFQKEFESLPQGMIEAHTEAMKPGNRGKNRYKKLYAYDDTRVVLDTKDGSESKSDYINACFVHGFNKMRKYIASQGPTTEILDDFWRMVWQTQCAKIVMLTNLVEEEKVKCEQYWPDIGSQTYGRIKVTIENTEMFSQFVIRTLIVQMDNAPKKTVLQFHFTAWPDRGVPKYASSLVQFLSKVTFAPSNGDGPVIVHCSAGVGRTGTFIALDNVTEQGKALGYVDVAGVVESMRKQRVSSVQTLDQYIFVYQAVVETLMLSTAAMPAARFPEAFQEMMQMDREKKKKKIYLEYETLKKMSPVAEECQYVSCKLVRNRKKNRYSNVLPIEEFMPALTKMDGSEDTEYINAVFLPSYKERKAFIITQTPLESTIEDFWRLVWEHEVHTVVMMNSREEIMDSEVYWPNVDDSLTLGSIVITNDGTKETNKHKVLSLSAKKFVVTRHIRLIQCGGWKSKKALPESPDVILSAMELVLSWQQQTGNHTVLVHCMNGVEKSGLFCVISAVIERMKIEQDVAIPHVIEVMRNAREQIIPSVEQYQFCHEAVLAFIKLYDTYSNFTD